MKNKDLYNILGVSRTATADEIKSAYRKLSMKYHPDRNTDKSTSERKYLEDKFKDINLAYSILGNKDERENYDLFHSIDRRVDPFSHYHKTTDFNDNRFNTHNRRYKKTSEELFCIGLMIGLFISTSLLLFFKDDITRFVNRDRYRQSITSENIQTVNDEYYSHKKELER